MQRWEKGDQRMFDGLNWKPAYVHVPTLWRRRIPIKCVGDIEESPVNPPSESYVRD